MKQHTFEKNSQKGCRKTCDLSSVKQVLVVEASTRIRQADVHFLKLVCMKFGEQREACIFEGEELYKLLQT